MKTNLLEKPLIAPTIEKLLVNYLKLSNISKGNGALVYVMLPKLRTSPNDTIEQTAWGEYVYYFNNKRHASALGYKSPVQYKTELGF